MDEQELCMLCHLQFQDFIMQQTMYRIKDPKKSLEFYTNVLGMRYEFFTHSTKFTGITLYLAKSEIFAFL